MVSFPEAVKLFYKRYADFDGRSSRSEYWWVILWQFLLLIVLCLPLIPWFAGLDSDAWLDDDFTDSLAGDGLSAYVVIMLVIIGIVFIGHIIPSIAVAVRRWHDLNQTGWLYLVFIILGAFPIIGWVADIANLIWFCFPGTKGENKYGFDPLSPNYEAFD